MLCLDRQYSGNNPCSSIHYAVNMNMPIYCPSLLILLVQCWDDNPMVHSSIPLDRSIIFASILNIDRKQNLRGISRVQSAGGSLVHSSSYARLTYMYVIFIIQPSPAPTPCDQTWPISSLEIKYCGYSTLNYFLTYPVIPRNFLTQ